MPFRSDCRAKTAPFPKRQKDVHYTSTELDLLTDLLHQRATTTTRRQMPVSTDVRYTIPSAPVSHSNLDMPIMAYTPTPSDISMQPPSYNPSLSNLSSKSAPVGTTRRPKQQVSHTFRSPQ